MIVFILVHIRHFTVTDEDGAESHHGGGTLGHVFLGADFPGFVHLRLAGGVEGHGGQVGNGVNHLGIALVVQHLAIPDNVAGIPVIGHSVGIEVPALGVHHPGSIGHVLGQAVGAAGTLRVPGNGIQAGAGCTHNVRQIVGGQGTLGLGSGDFNPNGLIHVVPVSVGVILHVIGIRALRQEAFLVGLRDFRHIGNLNGFCQYSRADQHQTQQQQSQSLHGIPPLCAIHTRNIIGVFTGHVNQKENPTAVRQPGSGMKGASSCPL